MRRSWAADCRASCPAAGSRRFPTFTAENGSVATRASSGIVLNALAAKVPELIGGSADLSGSNLTIIKDSPTSAPKNHAGRNIHFGVREHGMASMMNGMALHGGVIPYGGTFLVFADYMRPAIRLAALMHQRVIYVFTHDSIGLGEDGPTHQPVEHLTRAARDTERDGDPPRRRERGGRGMARGAVAQGWTRGAGAHEAEGPVY